jgi:hypothetical protein
MSRVSKAKYRMKAWSYSQGLFEKIAIHRGGAESMRLYVEWRKNDVVSH